MSICIVFSSNCDCGSLTWTLQKKHSMICYNFNLEVFFELMKGRGQAAWNVAVAVPFATETCSRHNSFHETQG